MSISPHLAACGIDVLPLGGRIGAEIRGVTLSGALPAATVTTIRTALLQYKVIFFRNQHIDDAEQEAFARLWGRPLIEHPTIPSVAGTEAILDVDAAKGTRAINWHTDFTFVEAYPSVSMLRAVVLPDRGGDTLWANTVAAYADLPPGLQALAESLTALHTNDYDYAGTRNTAELRPEGVKHFEEVFTRDVYQTEHPLVRVHPETGEKSLIIGNFIKKLVGYGNTDSRLLLEIFHNHATKPENTIRWHWQPGDLAIWDNFATLHRAVDDYGDRPRILRRTTLAGEPPVGVEGQRSRTVAIHHKPKQVLVAAE